MPQSQRDQAQAQARAHLQAQAQAQAQAQGQEQASASTKVQLPRTRAQQGQGTLNFITFGEPQQSPSTRAIRSHAAKAGWKLRKKSRGALLGPTADLPPAILVATPPPPPPPPRNLPAVPPWPDHDITAAVTWPDDDITAAITWPDHDITAAVGSSSSRSSSSADSSSRSTPLTTQFPRDGTIHDPMDPDCTDFQDLDDQCSPPRTELAPPQRLGSTHDPFGQFPVDWRDSYAPLVQFYRNCLGEKWMQLIAVDWGPQGNTEFVDFPLHISISQKEPAMFYAVLSNTSTMAPASNAISMRQQPFMSQWLRHKAVEALRVAVMDPARACSDSVICTVVYVYFNEALRSQRDTALTVHAPALKRMVDLRGGLPAIASNGKDGLILSRYLVWCDRIIAETLNIPLLFADYSEDPTVAKTCWNGMWSRVQTMM